MPSPEDPALAPTQTPAPEFARTVMATLEAPRTAADASLPTGGERYAMADLIGEGGMGRVLEARDIQFSRTVAVKTLHAGAAGTAARERFALEALVTGNLEHPGVPTVYERGTLADGSPFYAMRLVRGRTFAQAVADAPDMAARLKLVPVIIKVAQTLGFAHERAIVHRDIKPDNVVVGRHGEAVVLDWGIAKVRGVATSVDGLSGRIEGASGGTTAKTQLGSIVGTPAYMAPEQAAGDVGKIDERTDVFALGALLYHLITGHAPYDGPTTASVIERAQKAERTPLDSEAREAPQGIRDICEKAMARAPDDRYQTATELADALESFTANAVAGTESSAARWFSNGLGLLGLLVTVFAAAFATHSVSSFRDQGSVGYVIMFFGLSGCVLSAVEYATRGRHRLSSLSLAFACVTVIMGLAGTIVDLETVFRALKAPAVVADPAAFRSTLAEGTFESMGAAANALMLATIQFLVWGLAGRRASAQAARVAPEPRYTVP